MLCSTKPHRQGFCAVPHRDRRMSLVLCLENCTANEIVTRRRLFRSPRGQESKLRRGPPDVLARKDFAVERIPLLLGSRAKAVPYEHQDKVENSECSGGIHRVLTV